MSINKSFELADGHFIYTVSVFRMILAIQNFCLIEEDMYFPFGILRAVRGVDGVAAAAGGVELTDGAFLGFLGVGLAVELPDPGYDILPLQHDGDEGGRGHEAHQILIIILADMLGVVDGSQALIHLHELHGDDAEALFLVTLDDIAAIVLGKSIRLDKN